MLHTAGVAQLVEPSAGNLVREINRTLAITALMPIVVGAGLTVTVVAFALGRAQHWAWAILGILALVAMVWGGLVAHARDLRTKTVHLWFDLSDDAGARFKAFENAIQRVASCSRIWRVTARQATNDYKYNAGASAVLTRANVLLARRLPRYFESNVRPFALMCAEQTLYLFPDQVLVYEGGRVGAVSYDALEIDIDHSDFRETDSIPADAQVVDRTWQYVNKNGEPDRRFSSNRQIPVCRYGTAVLRSDSGLNIHLMFSRLGVAAELRHAEAQLVPLTRETARDADELAFEEWIKSRRS